MKRTVARILLAIALGLSALGAHAAITCTISSSSWSTASMRSASARAISSPSCRRWGQLPSFYALGKHGRFFEASGGSGFLSCFGRLYCFGCLWSFGVGRLWCFWGLGGLCWRRGCLGGAGSCDGPKNGYRGELDKITSFQLAFHSLSS